MSLTPTGTPWSGPRKRPSRASRSSSAAALRARARSIATHALIAPSSLSMRASNESTNSTAETLRSRTRQAASVSVSAYSCAIASFLNGRVASMRRVGSLLALEMRIEERNHLGPQLEGRFLAVARPVVGEERVAGVFEHVDGESLAGLLQALAQHLDLGGRGIRVFLAANHVERTTQSRNQIDDRRGTLRCGRRRVGGDAPAPAIDRRAQPVAAARVEQRGAPAHAKSDAADFTGDPGLRGEQVRTLVEIAHQLRVGQRQHPAQHDVHRVVGLRRADPRIKVRRKYDVAEVGEAPRHVADMLDHAPGLVNHDDAGIGAGLAWPHQVAVDRGAIALEAHVASFQAFGIGYLSCQCHNALLLGINPTARRAASDDFCF